MKMNPYPIYQKYFRNPKTRIWVIIASLVYIISTIDIIPDVAAPLAGLGIVDDGIVVVMFVMEMLNWLTSEQRESKEQQAKTEN